jgi:hypothetical protein
LVKRSFVALAGSIAVSIGVTSAGLADQAHAAPAPSRPVARTAQRPVGALTIVSPVAGVVTARLKLKGYLHQVVVPQTGTTAYVTGTASGGGQVAYKITPGQRGQAQRVAYNRYAIAVSISPDGRTVYMSVPDSRLGKPSLARIVPVSTHTSRAGRPLDVRGLGAQVLAMSVQSSNKVMYVAAAQPATLEAIQISSRKVIGRPIRLARSAGFLGAPQMMYSRSGSRLYVLYSLGSTQYSLLTVINTRTDREIGTVRVPGLISTGSEDLAVTPGGSFAYVVSTKPRYHSNLYLVTVLHVAARVSTVSSLRIGGASAIAEAPSGRAAYVAGADYGANEVGQLVAIPTATNKPSSPVTVAADTPMYIDISPDGRTAYLEEANDEIYPVDLTTDVVGAPITVGSQPGYFLGNGGMAFTRNGQILYVLGTITE